MAFIILCTLLDTQSLGAVITSLGGAVHLERTCFINNTAGIAPIVLDKHGGTQLTLSDVYVDGNTTAANTCALVAERDGDNANITCRPVEAYAGPCPLDLANFAADW